jgi:hypothetical protein
MMVGATLAGVNEVLDAEVSTEIPTWSVVGSMRIAWNDIAPAVESGS